jgi:hypothetical protein
MHTTVIRCETCGLARETKRGGWRGREPIDVCFCRPWRPDFELLRARELATPGGKLEQRE